MKPLSNLDTLILSCAKRISLVYEMLSIDNHAVPVQLSSSELQFFTQRSALIKDPFKPSTCFLHWIKRIEATLIFVESFSMSKFTDVFISVACLCLSVLKAQGSVLTRNASNVFLSYNEGNSHSVYDACAWKGPGTLSFLFNTRKHNTFLAYQDDGTYSNFDLFLVEGKIRARVNFDKCPWEQLIIEGNYSDSRWHRVRLTRSLSNVTLTVDGCHSQSIVCDISSPERERWHALYIGSIPLHITMNSLANPGIFQQAIASG